MSRAVAKRPRRGRGSRSKRASPERPPDGRVVARKGPVMTVETDSALVPCIGHGPGKGAVVGDRVWFSRDADTDMADGVVRDVAPRDSELVRAGSMGRRAQILAANVDTVFVVVSVEPPLREGLIDRYLAAAHQAGIDARVLFNKVDVLDDQGLIDVLERLRVYPEVGYPLHLTSAVTLQGVDGLREALVGRCSIFVGHSGVGKTSLLNVLDPGLGERVQALSGSSGRGQHTTTGSELYTLPSGGDVIDSPGVRAFGLWGMEPEEVKDCFVEFAARAGECRFADCQHLAEPGCAVKAGLEAGELSAARYESYLRIRESIDEDFAWRG